MPWKSYSPLTSGLLIPISVFLNVQALTVPGWFLASQNREYQRHLVLTVLGSISFGFGFLSVACLFVRCVGCLIINFDLLVDV